MDTIANLLISIKNSLALKKPHLTVPESKLSMKILEVLKRVGKILDYQVSNNEIKILLAYDKEGKPKIEDVKRVSKLGRRIYRSYKNFGDFCEKRGFLIVSTSKGLMTDKEARSKSLGGEIIAKII